MDPEAHPLPHAPVGAGNPPPGLVEGEVINAGGGGNPGAEPKDVTGISLGCTTGATG